MVLRIQQLDGRLTAIIHDTLNREVRSDLTPLLTLGEDLERFLRPILDGMRLKRPATIFTQIRMLKAFGEALIHLEIVKLPNSEEQWQALVLSVYRFTITRTDKKSSLKTRSDAYWSYIRVFFGSLIDAGEIPLSVYLPTVKKLGDVDITMFQNSLLGQAQSTKVNIPASKDKLIMSISLARTDAEYLEDIRDTLSHRRHLLFMALSDYWSQIKSNMEFGRSLISNVNWEEIRPLVANYPLGKPQHHPANPSMSITKLANYLAAIRYEYSGYPPSDDTLWRNKRKHEFIPRFNSIGPISSWKTFLVIPKAPYNCPEWADRNVLWWWQGRITHLDTGMIVALLIMLQPSWTPSSITMAKISNRHGKKYLEMTDIGCCYEVNKPRAKAMKHEILDPLAQEIISTLIIESAVQREILIKENDPKAQLLFLPCVPGKTKVVAPIPSMIGKFMSGLPAVNNMLWVGALYPHLVEAGLTIGTISFKKIRNTEGVLEWFKTKSLRAVSRKLGNTERVVLEHYIPQALLDAWNIRMIRRFQNLWLSVASANEEFLLDITDFSSIADLHSFLQDILGTHGQNDSPLTTLLHQRFGFLNGNTSPASLDDTNSHLHVAISKATLSALYSYQATIIDLGLPDVLLDKSDVVTGLSPRHFLALSDLLQSRLQFDKNPKYVECHQAALRFSADPSNRIKFAKLTA